MEFKEAGSNFDFNKLGKYFSALSNEANLKNNRSRGWFLVSEISPGALSDPATAPTGPPLIG